MQNNPSSVSSVVTRARLIYLSRILLLLCASLFASQDLFAGTELQGKYTLIKIAAGVSAQASSVSWSPDGKRFAFIDGGIHVYDVATRNQTKIGISQPSYVSWGNGDEVFVISVESGKKVLYQVDAVSLFVKKIGIDREPDAVFPVMEGRKLLVLSSKLKVHSLWTDLSYEISVYDRKAATARTLYEATGRLPVKDANIDYLSGWIHPAVNPFDTTTLTMEYVKPPVLPPYLKIGTVDYITGKVSELGKVNHRKFSVPGSWSPDGSRFAFADENGRLKIFDLEGKGKERQAMDDTVSGIYPAWNPKGSQIFFGGSIVNSDGKKKGEVIANGIGSVGHWSPDGTKLAVVTEKDLWLLEDYSPSLFPPDRILDKSSARKVLLLKELLSEHLLTDAEYEERYNRLLNNREILQ